jgi:PhzF family phenazine biosynthesis protein
MQFYIVDAFTDVIFGGNPAGVVIIDPKEKELPDTVMQKIAAELGFSETAFIRPLPTGIFSFRYFTPASEVELCGHATIGSFAALLEGGWVKDNGSYKIKTLAGELAVALKDGLVMMEMGLPVVGAVLDSGPVQQELAAIMGISEDQIGHLEMPLHPQIVSTGLPDILMPVLNRAILMSIKPNFQALSEFSKRLNVVGVHAFCLEKELSSPNSEAQIICRNFAPLYAIDEEAATGTANGALTYYLYMNNLIHPGSLNTVHQGESMGRPSLIKTLLLQKGDGSLQVQVGGSSVILSKGELLI